jgi:hypothetical protein
MSDLTERVTALETAFSRVYLGDWGGSGDGTVPYHMAIRVRTELVQLQASLVSAIHLVAQAQVGGQEQAAATSRLMHDIIDDWCPTPWPVRFPPRPRWGDILAELADLADRYAPGSSLRAASLQLCGAVLDHARKRAESGK